MSPRRRMVASAKTLLQDGKVPSADEVAAAAGVSRSTYFRVVGSHKELLNEAGYRPEPPASERILDAALEILNTAGIPALIMDDVADRAGVSRATLFRIFPSKSALIAAVATGRSPVWTLGPLMKQLEDRIPEEVLPALMSVMAPKLLAFRGAFRAVVADSFMESEVQTPVRSSILELYRVLGEYMERQMEMGRIRRVHVQAAVQSFVGPIIFYAVTSPVDGVNQQVTSEELVREHVAIWLRGMKPEGK